MKINIKDNLYITSDSRQYILSQYTGVDKEGKDTYKALSYHTSLDGALKGFANREMLNSEAETFSELLADVKKTNVIIENILKQLLGDDNG